MYYNLITNKNKGENNMKRTDYTVKIVEMSRELTLTEELYIKGGPDAVTIDSIMDGQEALIIDIDFYCVAEIHNENAKNDKDYRTIYLIDKSGMVYQSSSKSLINSIDDICDILSEHEATITDYPIKVVAMPSKNYAGKNFYKANVLLKKGE